MTKKFSIRQNIDVKISMNVYLHFEIKQRICELLDGISVIRYNNKVKRKK